MKVFLVKNIGFDFFENSLVTDYSLISVTL